MQFDVKEVIDKYGIDVAMAVDDILSHPKPLTKREVYEALDSMFPDEDVEALKELYGEDILERKEAMKYFWNEIHSNLLNGNSTIAQVALTGKYYLVKYNRNKLSLNTGEIYAR